MERLESPMISFHHQVLCTCVLLTEREPWGVNWWNDESKVSMSHSHAVRQLYRKRAHPWTILRRPHRLTFLGYRIPNFATETRESILHDPYHIHWCVVSVLVRLHPADFTSSHYLFGILSRSVIPFNQIQFDPIKRSTICMSAWVSRVNGEYDNPYDMIDILCAYAFLPALKVS